MHPETLTVADKPMVMVVPGPESGDLRASSSRASPDATTRRSSPFEYTGSRSPVLLIPRRLARRRGQVAGGARGARPRGPPDGRDRLSVHGGSRLAALRRLHVLRRRGYTYDEALRDGMLDPAIPTRDLKGYASRHVALIAQRRVNPGTLEDLTTEKADLLPVLHGHRPADPRGRSPSCTATPPGWGRATGSSTTPRTSRPSWTSARTDLVVKPSDGGKGVFVEVLRYEGGTLHGADGPRSPGALWDEMRSHPLHPCFVVQERLRNHPDLARDRALRGAQHDPPGGLPAPVRARPRCRRPSSGSGSAAA